MDLTGKSGDGHRISGDRRAVGEFAVRTLILSIPLLTFAFAAFASGQSDAGPPLPDGPGKDTFVSVCSLCHAPIAPMGKQWSRQEWELKVIEMLQEEPDVTREERAAIVEYLAANFRPGGKIYINMATAKDLESALEISAGEAEAIALYRKNKGNFSTIDDLKSVAGVNSSKIESKKDRIVF